MHHAHLVKFLSFGLTSVSTSSRRTASDDGLEVWSFPRLSAQEVTLSCPACSLWNHWPDRQRFPQITGCSQCSRRWNSSASLETRKYCILLPIGKSGLGEDWTRVSNQQSKWHTVTSTFVFPALYAENNVTKYRSSTPMFCGTRAGCWTASDMGSFRVEAAMLPPVQQIQNGKGRLARKD